MKHLIIYAHPSEGSLNNQFKQTIVQCLQTANQEVEVRDLNSLDFNPVLSHQDMDGQRKGMVEPDVKREQEFISWADQITFIYPIWWTGMPAIMKGYIDRVMSYGFAYLYDLMIWSPLSGGLLSGKYKRGLKNGEGRLNEFPFKPFNEERAYAILDVLYPMADQKKVSVSQLALGWLLHQPSVSSIIIGATKLHQLQDNLKAVEVTFTPEEMKQLILVSQLKEEYPGNVLEMMTGDRRS